MVFIYVLSHKGNKKKAIYTTRVYSADFVAKEGFVK